MNVLFKPLNERVKVPQYGTEFSAGFDLVADNFKVRYRAGNDDPDNFPPNTDYDPSTNIVLYPGDRMLVGCGFAVAIVRGFQMEVRPRSGLALKQGLTVLNAPGTIDADYRDEVGVILFNSSRDAITIKIGDRIAQGIIMPFYTANFTVVKELPKSSRSGGFGSTGIAGVTKNENY